MRISDWSSDVCSSDLARRRHGSNTVYATYRAENYSKYSHRHHPTKNFCSTLVPKEQRSEEHTSELQSLMRISYAVFCLKKKPRNKLRIRRYTIIRPHSTRTSMIDKHGKHLTDKP